MQERPQLGATAMILKEPSVHGYNTGTTSLIYISLIRLVPVVVWLYLTLVHVTSVFSLPFAHHGSSSKLQLLAHSHISISHISFLSHSQHHHSNGAVC
jgi:hypothetical protein